MAWHLLTAAPAGLRRVLARGQWRVCVWEGPVQLTTLLGEGNRCGICTLPQADFKT